MSNRPPGEEGGRDRRPDRRGDGSRPRGPGEAGPPSRGPVPSRRRRRRGPPARGPGQGQRSGSIRLAPLAGGDFELVHPRGVRETEPDYEEGLEIWRAGDPEGARDALRYALAACHDNLWIHVALGQIALEEFHDPSLALGHFGYAVELARRALPQAFTGRLPPERPSNRPFYEALAGLLECLEAQGRRDEFASLRALRDRLSSGGR
jgi:hypothetical protein